MPFTHFNEEGRSKMVDISHKQESLRIARASAEVRLNPSTFQLVKEGKTKKGDVLAVAQVAGIMAAKKCPDLIPMCHTILLSGVDIHFELDEEKSSIKLEATCRCKGSTGVEMEALCAATNAALTIYDMCKAHQRDIVISSIQLEEKQGGTSGIFSRGQKQEIQEASEGPRVVAVSLSHEKGHKKVPQDEIVLKVGHGIVGDAHAGNWHRQVSLLSLDSLNIMREKIPELSAGDFAENILVEGLEVADLPVGTKLKLGEAELSITQIGKECHKGCEIQKLTGSCIMPKRGVFAVVTRGGRLKPGDKICVVGA